MNQEIQNKLEHHKEIKRRVKEKLRLKIERMRNKRFSMSYRLASPPRGLFPLIKIGKNQVDKEIKEYVQTRPKSYRFERKAR